MDRRTKEKTNNKANLNTPFNIKAPPNSSPKEAPPMALYQSCTSPKNFTSLSKYLFDPTQWLEFYKTLFHPHWRACMRLMVQADTVSSCLRSQYFLPDGKVVHLNRRKMEKAIVSTKVFKNNFKNEKDNQGQIKKKDGKKGKSNKEDTEKILEQEKEKDKEKERNKYETEIVIVNGDCLDAALWIKNSRKLNVALLNMASVSTPGGGYRCGTSGQEENLHRRTNLFMCLEDPYKVDTNRQWSYPIPEFGAIYSQEVCVFRENEKKGYPYMATPDYVSIISAAAYSNPPTEENKLSGEVQLSKKIAQLTRKKIESILEVALQNGNTGIVLGAFGCDINNNPANHIASLFKDVLENEFKGCFKCIVFAIMDTKTEMNEEGNIIPFSKVFDLKPIRLEGDEEEEKGDKEDEDDEGNEDEDEEDAEADEEEEDEEQEEGHGYVCQKIGEKGAEKEEEGEKEEDGEEEEAEEEEGEEEEGEEEEADEEEGDEEEAI